MTSKPLLTRLLPQKLTEFWKTCSKLVFFGANFDTQSLRQM